MRISDWSSDVCSSDLPATLSANLSALPSAARPSVQNCMNDAARQIGVTGGTRLSYDRLVNLEQGNGGWRIRAAMTATYPDGARSMEMYCREIGRAAGSGRGCQDGEIWVVAGSFKKK